MDLGTQTVLSIAGLLVLNTAMVRLKLLRDRSPLFWAVQGLNIAVAGWILWAGIPGFDHIPAVSWVMSLWLLLRVATNHRWYMSRSQEGSQDLAREQRASAIRAALEQSDDEP